jgi:hypothetical protein
MGVLGLRSAKITGSIDRYRLMMLIRACQSLPTAVCFWQMMAISSQSVTNLWPIPACYCRKISKKLCGGLPVTHSFLTRQHSENVDVIGMGVGPSVFVIRYIQMEIVGDLAR